MAYAAAVTGGWSGLVCLAAYGVARLFGVPMQVTVDGQAMTVSWLFVLLLPLVAAEIGAIAALVVRGWKAAGRIVFWAGTLVAVLSLAPLVIQPDTTALSTVIWLAVLHVITWVLVVPQIARIIADSEPGMHSEREVIYT